jgi:hypothetical protein
MDFGSARQPGALSFSANMRFTIVVCPHSASGAGFGRGALNMIVKDFKSQMCLLTLKPLKSDFTTD